MMSDSFFSDFPSASPFNSFTSSPLEEMWESPTFNTDAFFNIQEGGFSTSTYATIEEGGVATSPEDAFSTSPYSTTDDQSTEFPSPIPCTFDSETVSLSSSCELDASMPTPSEPVRPPALVQPTLEEQQWPPERIQTLGQHLGNSRLNLEIAFEILKEHNNEMESVSADPFRTTEPTGNTGNTGMLYLACLQRGNSLGVWVDDSRCKVSKKKRPNVGDLNIDLTYHTTATWRY